MSTDAPILISESNVSDSLRDAVGIVPQDTVLFNETILFNIAYGHPDASRDAGAAEQGAGGSGDAGAAWDRNPSRPAPGHEPRRCRGGRRHRSSTARR